jgi:hypothetical protein
MLKNYRQHMTVAQRALKAKDAENLAGLLDRDKQEKKRSLFQHYHNLLATKFTLNKGWM